MNQNASGAALIETGGRSFQPKTVNPRVSGLS
jgi:hypothetical protein